MIRPKLTISNSSAQIIDLPVGVAPTSTVDEKVALVMEGVIKPSFMGIQTGSGISFLKTVNFIIIITDFNDYYIIIII